MWRDDWREASYRFGPPVFWMMMISAFSTTIFSITHTGRFIIPALHWLLPSATPSALGLLHAGIRKCMHLAEFGILALLWFRALGWSRLGWQGRMATMSWVLALCFAGLDEAHQIFVPGRTATVMDVGWDGLGAFLALITRYTVWRS
jgi:VanZ family protein